MPDCMLRYMPGPGRRELVTELMKELPDMFVATVSTAGMNITREKLVIVVSEFDALSYNTANVEALLMTGRGEGDRTYHARERMRFTLRKHLFDWLERHSDLAAAANVDDVEAIVRFAESCGVNFSAQTGEPNSSWGGPDDED